METDTEVGPRSFARFLEGLGDGDAHRELSARLQGMGAALMTEADAQRKKVKGKITLTVEMSASPEGVVGIAYSIKATEPTPRRPSSTMWVDENGNFVRSDPKQLEMGPLRDVSAGGEPMREAKEG